MNLFVSTWYLVHPKGTNSYEYCMYSYVCNILMLTFQSPYIHRYLGALYLFTFSQSGGKVAHRDKEN